MLDTASPGTARGDRIVAVPRRSSACEVPTNAIVKHHHGGAPRADRGFTSSNSEGTDLDTLETAIDAGREVQASVMPGSDRLTFMDSSEFNGLSDLAAVATREGPDDNYSWVVDADDTAGFCQVPSDPTPLSLSLSECATTARHDVGMAFEERVWPLGDVDHLFAPAT